MHEAKAICKRLGRQLFEPTNYSDNYKVTALARAKGVTRFWIGIHDKTTEGKFTYLSNGRKIGYSNWYHGEPNNDLHGEDCVQIKYSNGKWNDVPCHVKLSFVCEKIRSSKSHATKSKTYGKYKVFIVLSLLIQQLLILNLNSLFLSQLFFISFK